VYLRAFWGKAVLLTAEKVSDLFAGSYAYKKESRLGEAAEVGYIENSEYDLHELKRLDRRSISAQQGD